MSRANFQVVEKIFIGQKFMPKWWKKPKKTKKEQKLLFVMVRVTGLGLVATTQSRVFDFGFATLLGQAIIPYRQESALHTPYKLLLLHLQLILQVRM